MAAPGRRMRQRARPYQFSIQTSRAPEDVLQEFAERRLPDITVAERGRRYIVLHPRRRTRYSTEFAVALGVVIVLAVLILMAITPIFVVLLPVALLPSLPAWLDHRPDIAISAVREEDGGTRVTVHGQASTELAAALDAYLGSLPRYVPPPVAMAEPLARRAAG